VSELFAGLGGAPVEGSADERAHEREQSRDDGDGGDGDGGNGGDGGPERG
jgi:hypothetical protein